MNEYPVGLQIVYQDNYGVDQVSSPVIVGVPVDGKVEFKVTNVESSLGPGDKGLIKVTYTNTGNIKVYNAEARLSAVDPRLTVLQPKKSMVSTPKSATTMQMTTAFSPNR